MPEALLAPSFAPLVAALSGCFTAPSFVTFQHIVAGWILCIGRHTVTGVLRASGAVGEKHHTSFHRFFRAATWQLEAVGLCLIQLVVKLLPGGDVPIVVSLDDTLSRHTGKHIRGASMHHDPLLSTRAKPVFHWGHVWVVVSIVVRVPLWKKTFALPVLARLYRSQKLCEKDKRPFRKKTELAAELIAILAGALPERRIRIVADANYANASILKKLPRNVDFIGRAPMDAAVYARPRRQRMGRPPVKGRRLPSPKQRGRSAEGWRRVKVEVYGKVVAVQVKVFDVLWYRAAGGRLLRFVLVRGWPGHREDDVFCSTDLTLTAEQIVESYCLRWYLEIYHACCSPCCRSIYVLQTHAALISDGDRRRVAVGANGSGSSDRLGRVRAPSALGSLAQRTEASKLIRIRPYRPGPPGLVELTAADPTTT